MLRGLATPLQFYVTLFCRRVKTEKSILFRDVSLSFQMEFNGSHVLCHGAGLLLCSMVAASARLMRRKRREGAKSVLATTVCHSLMGFTSVFAEVFISQG